MPYGVLSLSEYDIRRFLLTRSRVVFSLCFCFTNTQPIVRSPPEYGAKSPPAFSRLPPNG